LPNTAKNSQKLVHRRFNQSRRTRSFGFAQDFGCGLPLGFRASLTPANRLKLLRRRRRTSGPTACFHCLLLEKITAI